MTVVPSVVPFSLLIALLGSAVAFDIRERRIPNRLLLIGLIAAVAWQGFGAAGNWAFDPSAPGASGLAGGVMGAVVLLLLFLPCHVLGLMGAGDVKLIAVVGAIFGARTDAWAQLPGVALAVLLAGGLLALLRLVCTPRGGAAIRNAIRIMGAWMARAGGHSAPRFDPSTDSVDRMPYAIAIAIGTLSYAAAKSAGWLTIF